VTMQRIERFLSRSALPRRQKSIMGAVQSASARHFGFKPDELKSGLPEYPRTRSPVYARVQREASFSRAEILNRRKLAMKAADVPPGLSTALYLYEMFAPELRYFPLHADVCAGPPALPSKMPRSLTELLKASTSPASSTKKTTAKR
jgi:hypothetical protein